MIITDEFLTEATMRKYNEDSIAEINASYVLVDFSKYLSGFPMNTCIDIGSNFGIFSINASKYFENVYAFEPGNLAELSSKLLVEHLDIRNIRIYNLAVTDKSGDILCLSNIPCLDGTRLSKDNTLLLNPSTSKVENQYEYCITIAYKDIFKLIEKEEIDYIKIDCEGAEYSILLGQDLSNVGIITGEMHNLPGHNYNDLRDSLINHLRKDFIVCASDHNFICLNYKYGSKENLINFLTVLENCGWRKYANSSWGSSLDKINKLPSISDKG